MGKRIFAVLLCMVLAGLWGCGRTAPEGQYSKAVKLDWKPLAEYGR